MTAYPLITIGITSYKSADTIAQAIQSALTQDWPNKEILIVDDGSGDHTVSVIQKAIEGHKNARLIVHEQNKGFAGALNTIIAEARGDFLAIFDDDDISDPTRIRRQYTRITEYENENNTQMVICHAARIQKYPNGTEWYEPTMGTKDGIAPHGNAVCDRILIGRLSPGIVGSCANCSRMARTTIFRQMGGYDATMRRAEDTDFNIRFGYKDGHFVGIADPLVTQAMTMGSEKTIDNEKRAETLLLEKHAPYLKKIGWYDFCRSWLDIRYNYISDDYIAFAKNIALIAYKHPLKTTLKFIWSMPARQTRNQYRKWHRTEEAYISPTPETIPKPAPLITIGICCYNSEDTVKRAVHSALNQDWENFEVIIVDDGSSDNTAQIAFDSIQGVPYARLIRHAQNKRFPGALNTVINNAKGEFIAIFDDDDESLPHRLTTQYKTIVRYEKKTGAKLVACWGSGVRRYPNGYEVKLEAIGSKPKNPVGETIIDFLLYFGKTKGVFYGAGTPSCSLMTRKSTYIAVGLYDESMIRSEDADFSIRLAKAGGHFIGCPENVFIQYSTGGAEKRAEVMYQSYLNVMEKHRDYLISKNRYDYALLWNKLRLHHFSKQKSKAIYTLGKLFAKHPLLTWKHFWHSAPRRLIHEAKMNRNRKQKA